MAKRYLEMHVEMGSIHGSGQTERIELPDDWDQMNESEQAAYADACYEDFEANHVAGGWSVMEVDGDG